MPLPLPSLLGTVAIPGSAGLPPLVIDIFDTEANILGRTGDPTGTIAFGTDTKALYIYNSKGFDRWSEFEDGFSDSYSILLNGTSAFMNVGDVDVLDSSTAFSMSCWVYFNAGKLTGKQCFISSGPDVNNTIRLHKGDNNELRFQVQSGGSGVDLSAGTTNTLALERVWYHVAATYSSGTAKIYLNGSLEQTGTTGSASSSGGDGLSVGRLSSGFNTHYMKGNINEVAIWNTTLSDADIYNIWNNRVTTDLSSKDSYDTDRSGNLVHWWRMGEDWIISPGVGYMVPDEGSGGVNGLFAGGGALRSTRVPPTSPGL